MPGKTGWRPRIILTMMVLAALVCCGAAQAEPPTADRSIVKTLSVEGRLRNTFRSNTSFEFGDPKVPGHTPLSRLEFPLNAWWAGVGARGGTSRLSMGIEVLRSVTGEASGYQKDSDWEDDADRHSLTTYSESNCRLEPSYVVTGDIDLKIGYWLGLPSPFDLRPVAGIRWQRFVMITHDGTQWYPASGGAQPAEELAGDSLRFEQIYWHYYLGLRTAWDMGHRGFLPPIVLFLQGDWAMVEGINEDWHILRAGRRITRERTRGDAWHVLAGMKIGLTKNIHAKIEADYLRLQTTGSHNMTNPLFNTDYSFEYGVKVWSEQMGVTMSMEWAFK